MRMRVRSRAWDNVPPSLPAYVGFVYGVPMNHAQHTTPYPILPHCKRTCATTTMCRVRTSRVGQRATSRAVLASRGHTHEVGKTHHFRQRCCNADGLWERVHACKYYACSGCVVCVLLLLLLSLASPAIPTPRHPLTPFALRALLRPCLRVLTACVP